MDLQTTTPYELSDSDVASITKLASLNCDSSEMFKTGSDETSDSKLKTFFLQCSKVRSQFASDFRRLLADSHNEPPPDGSLTRVLHQWWLEIRELLTHTERHAILDELFREEEVIKVAYEDAFANVTNTSIREVIESHYDHIRKIHNAVGLLHSRTQQDPT